MYSISAKDVSVHAPTLAEVKELFKFATGQDRLSEAERKADAEATTFKAGLQYQNGDIVKLDGKPVEVSIPSASVAELFDGSRVYAEGESAKFGDKVFTKVNGEWVDPSVITPAELIEAEELARQGYHTGGPFPGEGNPPNPQAIFGASSSVGAAPSMTAQVGTPASEVPPPPAASSPALQSVPTPPGVLSADEAHAAGVELDKRGLPWDARIHSSSKNKLKDGNWKLARGVDPALVAKVEAELYATLGTSAAPVVPPITVAEPEFVPPPPPAEESDPTDFTTLLARLSKLSAAGSITTDQIAACAMTVGAASLPALASRPDLIPAFWKEVQALK